ncbi:MAG: hypothetical protein Q8L29_02765 [archaeon]|nr:hypothetical protein [archaeon]
MIEDIILIVLSIINIFVIAILLAKKKFNVAIGLSILQAFAWTFKLMGYY